MNSPETIKQLLLEDIDSLIKYPELFARNPEKDFTRTRKLPAKKTILFQIGMERDSINRELLKYFDYDLDVPSVSAFYQQRKKLKADTFSRLFHTFNSHFKPTLYRNKYIPVAVDGSGFNMFRDPKNEETFRPPNGQTKLGYSEIFVVAAYQLLDKVFTEAIIKPSRIKNEYTAICEIMDRHDNSYGIPLFLADRGFPSYNCFAHAKEKNAAFVIRAKDDYATRLLREDKPDSDEFDLSVDRIIVRHKRKKQYLHPELEDRYRYVDANTSFDFIEHGKQDEYELHLRVARIKIKDGVYENLITNLSPEEFSANDLKELYRLRWDEEISFRELKHILGAADFHSKIVGYVSHELWARLLLYNFSSQITRLAVINKKDKKHRYQVNFTMAYQTCREFLRRNTQESGFEVLALIEKYILPVRPDRKYKRNKLFQRPMTFTYRH